jgi:hypothetical protein
LGVRDENSEFALRSSVKGGVKILALPKRERTRHRLPFLFKDYFLDPISALFSFQNQTLLKTLPWILLRERKKEKDGWGGKPIDTIFERVYKLSYKYKFLLKRFAYMLYMGTFVFELIFATTMKKMPLMFSTLLLLV